MYDMKLTTAVTLASMRTGTVIVSEALRGVPVASGMIYKVTMPSDIKTTASQMRRCQKRLNATG